MNTRKIRFGAFASFLLQIQRSHRDETLKSLENQASRIMGYPKRENNIFALIKDFLEMSKKEKMTSLSFYTFMEKLLRHDWFLQFALENYPQKFLIWLYQLKEGLGDEFFFKDSLDNLSGGLSLKVKLYTLLKWFSDITNCHIGQHYEELTRVVLESWDRTETRFSFLNLLRNMEIHLNPLKVSVVMATKTSESLEGIFKTISSLAKKKAEEEAAAKKKSERTLELKEIRVVTPDKDATKPPKGPLGKAVNTVSNGARKAVNTVSKGARKAISGVTSVAGRLSEISLLKKKR